MSRSGYVDDFDNEWQLIRWRGAVASAIRGKRGQAFLREMLAALDAIPTKQLLSHELDTLQGCCALGAVGRQRHMEMSRIDPEDRDTVAGAFAIPFSLACEIMYENDEGGGYWRNETPKQRWVRVRRWVESKLRFEVGR